MNRSLAVIAAALLSQCSPGQASRVDQPPPVSDAPVRLFPDAQVDAIRLLAPPPTEGSAAAARELSDLHALIASATPADLARARTDNSAEITDIFDRALGPAIDVDAMAHTVRLLEQVRAAEAPAASAAKEHFRRRRPSVVDPSIRPCFPDLGPDTSYPSGHATRGYALAVVLARLEPAHADQIMARAAEFGQSRMICGAHFPSDIAASKILGTAVAEALMRDQGFRAQMRLAEAEFEAARSAAPRP